MSDPINMMDDFTFSEISTQMLFHNQAMFQNIKVWLGRVGMIPLKDKNVTSFSDDSATLPAMTFFAKLNHLASTTGAAKAQSLMAGYKCLVAILARFFIINLGPTTSFSFKRSMPNSSTSVDPFGTFYVFNFHNDIVSKFIGFFNGLLQA